MERDDSLAEAFWTVARALRQGSAESLARFDVTPAQARVLRVLSRHGELRLSALSEHLRIAARSTTEVVDDLVTKGLLVRTPDPADRRATLVGLTADGTRLLAAVRAERGPAAEAMFDRLGAADRAHLARILRELAQ